MLRGEIAASLLRHPARLMSTQASTWGRRVVGITLRNCLGTPREMDTIFRGYSHRHVLDLAPSPVRRSTSGGGQNPAARLQGAGELPELPPEAVRLYPDAAHAMDVERFDTLRCPPASADAAHGTA